MSDVPNDSAAGTGREEARLQMRLRPGRAPVTRLSRKVIVVLAFILAIAIAAALFFALRSGRQIERAELYGIDNRMTPDGLSNLPRDYAGLPKNVPPLGPPLPGDLGRPILNAGATHPSTPGPVAADPEKQRIAQEQEAARLSRLFATTNVRQTPSAAPISASVAGPPDGPTGNLAPQDRKLAFLNGNVDRRTTSGDRIEAPASPYVLQAGAVIPAALLTGLRSDLPGQVADSGGSRPPIPI
jgi:type IV secretion system protein VirB10